MSKLDIQPNLDFNWEEFESGVVSSSVAGSREEQAARYESTVTSLKEGEVARATVKSINKREVLVNVGFKSDASINYSEFRYNPDLAIGDEVEVLVQSLEDKNGQISVSHRAARAARAWEQITEAFEKEEVVRGVITARVRGGMNVEIFGVDAFLPGSHLDVRPVKDFDAYVGKTIDVKIVKINNEYRNVIVSHKVLIEAEMELQKAEIISKLEKGQVLEGEVKNIVAYGVFVDLGGIDGLIHITDLSWGRVSHPSEVVAVGQNIQVVILDFDPEKLRIALGLKQLTAHPWEAYADLLQEGKRLKGTVRLVADYGAFVEVAPGIEGLVHVSEMSWTQHLRNAQEFLKEGEEVEVVVLNINPEERKLSLGIKQLIEDPWENIEARFPVGSRHTVKVRNFTNFGIFAQLEPGIDGLIHVTDLSWTKRIKNPAEFTRVGESIDIIVLEIDKATRRLSLGHKQIEDNPWASYETVFSKDSVHEGTVLELIDRGAVITLPYGVEAIAMNGQLVKEDGSTLAKGETAQFKVVEFRRDSQQIIVSHTRTYRDTQRAEARAAERAERGERTRAKSDAAAAIASNNASTERTTLGDFDALAALKDKLS